MATQSYKNFVKGLSKTPNRIFMFNGDENFLKDEGIELLVKKYEGTYEEDFDFRLLEGKDAKPADLSEELTVLPMMSENRILIIRNADKCPIKSKNMLKKWLNSPADHLVCGLTTSERLSPKKVKFVQEFVDKATVVNCYQLDPDSMFVWIKDRMKSLGKTIDGAALPVLVDLVGVDLYKMSNELKKIAIYVGARETVTLQDVQVVISDIRTDTIFDLVDAIIMRNLKTSMRMIGNVIREQSDQAILLVSLLTRQLKNLMIYRDLKGQAVGDGEIARKIGINPYFLQGLSIQAANVGNTDILPFFNKLLLVDIRLKSSPASYNSVVEGFVVDFCSI